MPTLSELSQKTEEVIYIQESSLGGNQGIVFQAALKNGFIHKLYVNSKTTRLAEMGLGKVPQITGTRNQHSALRGCSLVQRGNHITGTRPYDSKKPGSCNVTEHCI